MPRPRVLSGIQPTGSGFHVGNYLGAVRNWVAMQETHDTFYCIVDLHAITAPHDPAVLRRRTRESAAELLAMGLDPTRCTLFVQSHVPLHAELGWVLGCITGFGEASRMTQFKDKGARGDLGNATVGLFCYPILQAADILIYQADQVPVGDDQRQHLELTRDLAQRFNTRFGQTFTVPEAFVPKSAGRILDLQDPAQKMSKSLPPAGTLYLQTEPASLSKQVKRAVTDTGSEVRYDLADKPGLSNLMAIYAEIRGRSLDEVAGEFAGAGYGDFKTAVAEAVVDLVTPIQQRYTALVDDTEALDAVLADGAVRARLVAEETMDRVRDRVGFLPPKG